MTFWQNVSSTFIGALFGFVFSLFLFYLTTKWARSSHKKSLEKNLVQELQFNIDFLKKVLGDLGKVIERITVDERNVFYFFEYARYQSFFLLAYFQQGYLYEKLDSDDINSISTILNKMNLSGQNYINSIIQMWKDSNMDQKQALATLGFERDSVEGFIKNLDGIKKKIVSR